MATEEDLKKDDAGHAPVAVDEPEPGSLAVGEPRDLAVSEDEADADEGETTPAQFGSRRFVYAAYFAGAIGVAFLTAKAVDAAWMRLAAWKPQFGDPQDELIFPLAGLIGALVAWYYWKNQKTRELTEEVASELSKVTWPNKEEVVNSTAVVIVTTLFSTIFFALMDRFWGFLTNLVYGT